MKKNKRNPYLTVICLVLLCLGILTPAAVAKAAAAGQLKLLDSFM